MNKNNKTLKDIFATALDSYKKKDLEKAEVICYKILSIDPNHFSSIFLLATIFALQTNFEKAKELLHQAIKIEPENTNALNNLGTCYKELGKFNEAKIFFEKILEIDLKHTNANYNLGLVFYSLGDLKKSKIFLQKTIEIQSNYALAHFSLGNVHLDLKEFERALSCYQKAIEIRPDYVSAHNNLGLVFRTLNDFDNAVSSYERAVKIQPNHAGAYHNMALALKELGDFDKSIKAHQKAILNEPENLTHYYYISELKKDILDSTLKTKIEKIKKNEKSKKINLAYANFLLAKYAREEKNYDKEFNYLVEAHNNFFLSRKKKFDLGVKYCFDDVLQIHEGAKVTKLNDEKYNEIKPIFIVGVPRCGSTLVEKIIGSGKTIIPMGEETAFFENFINNKILEKQSLNLGRVKDIRIELSDIYKKRGLISKKYDYTFTDKSLNNFFYLELIVDIYPKAKIINCKRDTLSSIISIFQNNLTELAWTHNLENIFKYFDNYFNIIENYNQVYPNFIYDLEFENLVNNPLEESKKLMKFCELPWDKKCLEFYKRKDLISKTASNIQIREAIYKHSLNKYMPYKKFLDKYGKKYSWFN